MFIDQILALCSQPRTRRDSKDTWPTVDWGVFYKEKFKDQTVSLFCCSLKFSLFSRFSLQILLVTADLEQEEGVKRVMEETINYFGGLDVLVRT